MAIWYVEPINGNDANSGVSVGDAFKSMDAAFTAANTDGSAGQIIYVVGNTVVTPVAQANQATVTVDDLSIIAMDNNGNTADQLDKFDWAYMPVWAPGMATSQDAIRYQGTGAASTLTVRGIVGYGAFGGRYAFSNIGANAAMEFYDCALTGFFIGGVDASSVVKAERCWFDSMQYGLHVSVNGAEALSCVFSELTDTAFWKSLNTIVATAKHCLTYHCDGTGGSYPFRFADTPANWTIQNCLFIDNPTTWGCHGGSYTSNNCYTSDGATYHTTANWSGTPDADDYELDPLFVDAAGEDWHLEAASPVVGLQGGTGNPEYTRDRRALPNVLGPYGITAEVVKTIVRGQNLIYIEANDAWTLEQQHPDRWTLSGPFDTPRVAGVELVSAKALHLWTDMTLHEETAYTLGCLALFATTDPVPDQNIVGKRLSTYERPTETLVDIDHSPFEDMRLDADGDMANRGGWATIRKVVLDTLMTPAGFLPWNPSHGFDLEHKKPRPLNLEQEARRRRRQISSIPGVLNAWVGLEWREDYHLIATVRIQTEFGPINERVDLSAKEVVT